MPSRTAPSFGAQHSFLTAYARSTADLLRTAYDQRRLLKALAKRDLSDDYVAHRLSMGWTLVQPLFLMLVYLFIFTAVYPARVQAPLGLATDATIYLLSGIIPWITLSQVMGRSLVSVVGSSNIVKQMAFPLELLPLKTLATPLLFGAVSLVFLVSYSAWITGGAIIPVYLWGIPLLVSLSLVLYAGIALLLGTVQVFAREAREFIIMFLNIGLFIHPILFLPGAVPRAVRPVIYASPFSYYIFCWQDILFFGGVERVWAWCITAAFAGAVFVLGARLFVGSKPHFGDFL
jgi:lipopolysaccharide transport system permease protein